MVSNGSNDRVFAEQLQQDLAEGESWQIELKEYDHARLEEGVASAWKDSLAKEFAALASIGGRIYRGINDAGVVRHWWLTPGGTSSCLGTL